MKRVIIIALTLLAMSSSVVSAQVVVRMKPSHRKVVVVKTNRPSANHVWINGHWKWNSKRNKYTWVDGRWNKSRVGYTYISGHWSRSRAGYKWVEGYWRKRVA